MLPFANRLSPASFEWDGAATVLQSPGPSGQGLHGFGHRQAWTVMQTTASSLLLSYVHQAPTDEWPWSFCAEIAYALTPSGLSVEVTIKNLSLLPMPAVLGWHPFIPLPDQFDDASGSLSIIATKTYAIGSDGLGHAQISAAPLEIQTLAAMLTSAHTTAYENWSGTVQIPLSGTSDLTLSSSDAKHLLIHVPTGLQHVCIEPITALPGALQRYSDHQKKMHLSLLSNEQKKITCCLGLHTIL